MSRIFWRIQELNNLQGIVFKIRKLVLATVTWHTLFTKFSLKKIKNTNRCVQEFFWTCPHLIIFKFIPFDCSTLYKAGGYFNNLETWMFFPRRKYLLSCTFFSPQTKTWVLFTHMKSCFTTTLHLSDAIQKKTYRWYSSFIQTSCSCTSSNSRLFRPHNA